MKRVYISHPLRGLDAEGGSEVAANIAKVAAVCSEIATNEDRYCDIVPVSPIHAFSFCDPVNFDAERALDFCRSLLCVCDEMWVFGPWWTSCGCRDEIRHAAALGLPIVFFNSTLFEDGIRTYSKGAGKPEEGEIPLADWLLRAYDKLGRQLKSPAAAEARTEEKPEPACGEDELAYSVKDRLLMRRW